MLSDYVSVVMSTVDPLQERTQDAILHLQRSTAPYELILLNRNRSWTTGTIANQGIAACVGDFITFLCDDCFIEPSALKNMKQELQDETVGVVGALLQYPNGLVQHAGGYVYVTTTQDRRRHVDLKHIGQHEPMRNYASEDVDFVTGAFMMTRVDVLERIGWYSSDCDLTWGDVDFCFRARKAGYRVRLAANARGVHLEGATRGNNMKDREIAGVQWFLDKWGRSEYVIPPEENEKDIALVAIGGSD